jgi:hypothetical protein
MFLSQRHPTPSSVPHPHSSTLKTSLRLSGLSSEARPHERIMGRATTSSDLLKDYSFLIDYPLCSATLYMHLEDCRNII